MTCRCCGPSSGFSALAMILLITSATGHRQVDLEHEPIGLRFGQGIVPSWSMGFCVAMTMNGVR